MDKKSGITMIELIITITVIAVLAVAFVAVLNPAEMFNRAQDARRKKDLSRIKVAFEEYFNDRGCYPTKATVDALVCQSSGFSPWLSPWPCDPLTAKNYNINIGGDDAGCPKNFQILAQLRSKNDPDIPAGWYNQPHDAIIGDGTITVMDANYGVSSQNIPWYKRVIPPECFTGFTACYLKPESGRCQATDANITYQNVYLDPDCSDKCFVSCCYQGKSCD